MENRRLIVCQYRCQGKEFLSYSHSDDVTDLVEGTRQSTIDKHLVSSAELWRILGTSDCVSQCCSCTRSVIPVTWCNAPLPLDVQSGIQSQDPDIQGSNQTDLHRRARIMRCVCVHSMCVSERLDLCISGNMCSLQWSPATEVIDWKLINAFSHLKVNIVQVFQSNYGICLKNLALAF